MTEQQKMDQERSYQDGHWYWVKYEGLHKEYGAPAMYKANCDAWYSFEFSGIPTRQVEVVGPCVPASLPAGVPNEPTHSMVLAGEMQWESSGNAAPDCAAIYRAMLYAAPAAQPAAERKCITCQDSGVVGHSDICPECETTWQPAAEQSPTAKESLTVAEQSAPGECKPILMVRTKGSVCWEEVGAESYEFCQQESSYECRTLYAAPTDKQSAPGEVEGWRDQLLRENPKSLPAFWPDSLILPAMQREIQELRDQLAARDAGVVRVPRDLLADLVSQDHDTRIQAERRMIALLAQRERGGE